MTQKKLNAKGRCEFVIRLAGQNEDGTPLGPTYAGDTTETCGRWGEVVECEVPQLVRAPGCLSALIPKTVRSTRCLCDLHR